MARIAKLRKAPIDEREVWEAIIRYANGDRDVSASAQVEHFKKLIAAGFDWIDRNRESTDGDDWEICADYKDGISLATLADRYRSDFRFMLVWLVAPHRWSEVSDEDEWAYQDLVANAGDFLSRHAFGIRMHLFANTDALATDDLEGRRLVDIGLDECTSVIAPVCKFILDQIIRHDERREELRKVIPVGHCESPGCERFFLVQRIGRGHFCSDACRAKAGAARMTKEQNRKRMAKYRANLKEMVDAKTVRVLKSKAKGRAK